MPRVPVRQTSEVPELESVYAEVESYLGVVPNSLRTMAHQPAMARAFVALNAAVMGPGRIEPGLKQLVALMVSSAAGCAYCQAHTAMVADERGVDADKIEQIWTFETSPVFSAAERAALRVAFGAGQVPNAVTDEDFAALHDHFDVEQVCELVGVMATFGFLNRWNDTMATTLERSPLAFADDHLAGNGWSPDKHLDAPAPAAPDDHRGRLTERRGR